MANISYTNFAEAHAMIQQAYNILFIICSK